tara:strand:+ start:1598 stop:2194 length:597 start_codon:yes stop_codon:yes gene_type:complete
MRKFTLALLTLFCLASCEKTETNNNSNNNNNQTNGTIVGTWKLNSIDNIRGQEGYIDPSSGNQVYTFSVEYATGDSTWNNLYWVFNNDNSLIEYSQYEEFDNQLMWDTFAYSYTYNGISLEIFEEDGSNLFNQISINTLNDNTFDFDATMYEEYGMNDTVCFEEGKWDNIRFIKSTLPEIVNPRLSLKKNNLFFKKEK